MKIGEFAAACGISVRMLRFYEDAGILYPRRNGAGYRLYDEQDIEYVRKVSMLNRAGLALKDIAILRDCLNDRPQDFCPALRGKLHEVSAKIERQIIELQALQTLLACLLGKYGGVPETPDRQPIE